MKTSPVPCTKEEINNLISAAADSDFYYTLFTVAKKTGRRLGEYYDVQVKDIDYDRKVMMTKVLKRRQRVFKEAILTEDLIVLLKRYITKKGLKLDDFLFREHSYRHIQNRVEFYAKKAGIPHKVSFHNFRHYFVTELFKLGWTYDKIAKLTGHSSVGTLAVYDHTVASDLRVDALQVINQI
jgi:integrase|tara:strand:- start:386 stop:931 length:546 start_codon:yes stop_codon:yes gene_type:complete